MKLDRRWLVEREASLEDNDRHKHMPHLKSPRLLPSVNYGAILQAAVILATAVAVVVTLRVQQSNMIDRMNAMQSMFDTNLNAQVQLMNARIQVIQVELAGKIEANEARIGNQERLLTADIGRIREMLEDLTKELRTKNAREQMYPSDTRPER